MLAAFLVNLRGVSKVCLIATAVSLILLSDSLQVLVSDQVYQESRIR